MPLMIIFRFVSTQTTCFLEEEPGMALERGREHQVLFLELGSCTFFSSTLCLFHQRGFSPVSHPPSFSLRALEDAAASHCAWWPHRTMASDSPVGRA